MSDGVTMWGRLSLDGRIHKLIPAFLNENVWILIKISLNFVPKGLIDNEPALVQVMAWRRAGDKPLPELMFTQFIDAYRRHYKGRWVDNMEIGLCVLIHWSYTFFALSHRYYDKYLEKNQIFW